jgi:hypothetical protein
MSTIRGNKWSGNRGTIVTLPGGYRQKENSDGLISCVVETEEPARADRNQARLVQKIYGVDPLTCPKCHGGGQAFF